MGKRRRQKIKAANKITADERYEGPKLSRPFIMGVVVDVISNPIDYFSRPAVDIDGKEEPEGGLTLLDIEDNRVDFDQEKFSKLFTNSEMASRAPQNSIGVRLLSELGEASIDAGRSTICYPFFPQHLSLPCKPGEYVWIYRAGTGDYYWLCRVSSHRQIDDPNFTHLPRVQSLEENEGTKDDASFYHFDTVRGGGSINRGFFEKIARNSIAYREEFTGEVVPRIAKNCGDLLLQGSNNAIIQLGTEKFEEPSTTVDPNIMTPYQSSDPANENRKPLSPAIDMCVLRKSRELFDLKSQISAAAKEERSLETKEGEAHAGLGSGLGAMSGFRKDKDSDLNYYENDKTRDVIDDSLGKDIFTQEFVDSDIYNCIARVYMTNCRSIDDLLLIPDAPGESSSRPQDVLGLGNFGAMVALGANTRLVGTETVKIQNIVGRAGIQMNPRGDVIIHGNRNGGAKIVLMHNGNIRILPGPAGLVKIGGDGANIHPVGGIPFSGDGPIDALAEDAGQGTTESDSFFDSLADAAAEAVDAVTGAIEDVTGLDVGTDLADAVPTALKPIEPIATISGGAFLPPDQLASGDVAKTLPAFGGRYATRVQLF